MKRFKFFNLRALHPTEDAVAVHGWPPRAGLATLLASHILRDGELVLLILKPSLWFIPLQSMIFAAVVMVFAIGGSLVGNPSERRDHVYFEAAVFLISGRIMWAVLQWMGRLYVLTDMRILRLSGVFTINLFDCPLRKVEETRLLRTLRERLLGLGSVLVLPIDPTWHYALWQTVAMPREVQAKIVAAIHKAKSNGSSD